MQTRTRWLPGNFSLKTRFSLAVGLLILFTAAILTLASVLIVKRGIEWDPLESTCRHASLSIL